MRSTGDEYFIEQENKHLGNREAFNAAKKLPSAVTAQVMKPEHVKYVVFHWDWQLRRGVHSFGIGTVLRSGWVSRSHHIPNSGPHFIFSSLPHL